MSNTSKRFAAVVLLGIVALVVWGLYADKHSKLSEPPGEDAAAAPVAINAIATSPSILAIENGSVLDIGVYIAFGSDSAVIPSDLPLCRVDAGLTCDFILKAGATKEIPLGGRYLNATIAFSAPVGCGSTKAELNMNNPKWYDTIDVSLVDGYNAPVAIDVTSLAGADASSRVVLGPVTGEHGNERAYGVFPLGCDICVARQHPPCGMAPGKAGCKAGPDQYHPDVICQYQGASFGGGSRVIVKRL